MPKPKFKDEETFKTVIRAIEECVGRDEYIQEGESHIQNEHGQNCGYCAVTAAAIGVGCIKFDQLQSKENKNGLVWYGRQYDYDTDSIVGIFSEATGVSIDQVADISAASEEDGHLAAIEVIKSIGYEEE